MYRSLQVSWICCSSERPRSSLAPSGSKINRGIPAQQLGSTSYKCPQLIKTKSTSGYPGGATHLVDCVNFQVTLWAEEGSCLDQRVEMLRRIEGSMLVPGL